MHPPAHGGQPAAATRSNATRIPLRFFARGRLLVTTADPNRHYFLLGNVRSDATCSRASCTARASASPVGVVGVVISLVPARWSAWSRATSAGVRTTSDAPNVRS